MLYSGKSRMISSCYASVSYMECVCHAYYERCVVGKIIFIVVSFVAYSVIDRFGRDVVSNDDTAVS